MRQQRRAAAIDIGTNSVLLLIAERGPRGWVPLVELCEVTRLGRGVDRSLRLGVESKGRTLACLREYSARIARVGVDTTLVVGTSALREAADGAEFCQAATQILGVSPRVIDGDEEATLTYFGALSGLDVSGDVMVVDIGGGSTEIISGFWRDGSCDHVVGCSLDVGSVRLTERLVSHDPPLSSELSQVREQVRRALLGVAAAPSSATVVAVAGTATTLAAVLHGIDPYDSQRVHGSVLERQSVEDLGQCLARETGCERCRRKGLPSNRADIIVVGSILLGEVLTWAGCSHVTISDRGVRWGLVERLGG